MGAIGEYDLYLQIRTPKHHGLQPRHHLTILLCPGGLPLGFLIRNGSKIVSRDSSLLYFTSHLLQKFPSPTIS